MASDLYIYALISGDSGEGDSIIARNYEEAINIFSKKHNCNSQTVETYWSKSITDIFAEYKAMHRRLSKKLHKTGSTIAEIRVLEMEHKFLLKQIEECKREWYE